MILVACQASHAGIARRTAAEIAAAGTHSAGVPAVVVMMARLQVRPALKCPKFWLVSMNWR